MDKKYTLHAVTMTHWDREWYMDFQKTRLKLVHLIDALMDILENDPDFVSFMMDGQTLPLTDYLVVRPGSRERLSRHIREGRILIGPWYILPDEILITGETHIRNYLLGSRVAVDFGVEKMQVGYLPDSFGHPSQMPQILSGLGMDTIVFWRGSTPETDRSEFFWRAPDGTKVLTILMPDGYGTGAELLDDPDVTAARLDQYIESFHKYATTEHIYLSNGGDHLEPPPYLSKVLKGGNERMRNGGVRHTTLPAFIRMLKRSLGEGLKEVSGELCGASRSILLLSTLSTRTYLKQANHDAARLLENELEPMFALALLGGYAYPRDELTLAWKYLMENQPHDSICGCSIDRVHEDMLFRYRQVREIGGELTAQAKAFYRRIDTSGIPDGAALAVFNMTGVARTDYVEATVDFDARPTMMLDFNQTDEAGRYPRHYVDNSAEAMREVPTGIRVFDGERELPAVLIEAKVSNYMDLGYRRFPHQYNVNRCVIGFVAEGVPALGYKTLRVEPVYGVSAPEVTGEAAIIENEFFMVEPDLALGSVTVTDKGNGRVLRGLNRLSDGGDCGDEYTYCPPDRDRIVFPAPESLSARVAEKSAARQVLEIKGVMRLPKGLHNRSEARSPEEEDCPFTNLVTLHPGVRRIDIRTTFENRAEWHRLRALFPAGVRAEAHWSAGAFTVDRRPMVPEPDPNAREICLTHPQKDFCTLDDGAFGLTVANRGLHEYEAFDDGETSVLAVTLLRCTGVISQRVIATRDEAAGWHEAAPGAQCPGSWDFEYSVIPHEGDWVKSCAYLEARSFNLPMPALQLPAGQLGDLNASCGSVRLNHPALLISAFKQCEFEDALILRFYNTTPEKVDAEVALDFPFEAVRRANLREDTVGAVDMHGRTARMKVGPFEIVTLKILL